MYCQRKKIQRPKKKFPCTVRFHTFYISVSDSNINVV